MPEFYFKSEALTQEICDLLVKQPLWNETIKC